MIDFVRLWSDRADIPAQRFIAWIGISVSKYYVWVRLYGKVNEHNSWIPRDFWLEDREKEAIKTFHAQ